MTNTVRAVAARLPEIVDQMARGVPHLALAHDRERTERDRVRCVAEVMAFVRERDEEQAARRGITALTRRGRTISSLPRLSGSKRLTEGARMSTQ